MHALMHGTEFWYSLKMTSQRPARRNFVAVSQEFMASLPLIANLPTFRSSLNRFEHAGASYPLRATSSYRMKEFREDQA